MLIQVTITASASSKPLPIQYDQVMQVSLIFNIRQLLWHWLGPKKLDPSPYDLSVEVCRRFNRSQCADATASKLIRYRIL